MPWEAVTQRFDSLVCPESDKDILRKYLFSSLAESSYYKLKRNRVMIREVEKKDRFVILDLVPTANENEHGYICPKCSTIDVSNMLTKMVSSAMFKNCIHTRLCELLWGNTDEFKVDIDDNEDEDLVEIVSEKPEYLAAVHISNKVNKRPGAVYLTSKTLKPKCVVCPGQDCCQHLKVHMCHFKRGLDEESMDKIENKRIKIDRIEPVKTKWRDLDDSDLGKLDPFRHDGPDVNVFGVTIDLIKSKEEMFKNKQDDEQKPFEKQTFVEQYDPEKVCDHGNKYDEKESILNVESNNVIIHHTTKVADFDRKVLFRPTVSQSNKVPCKCKSFYSGKDDKLIRVSPTNNNQTGRFNKLHFVSHEYYFTFLGQLIEGGETLSGFIKAKRFTNQLFFGAEKSPEYKRILQKGFEIFCHALKIPEDANFCYECPQELQSNENEDDFADEIEVSVIDGIQMGCRTHEMKAEIKDEYFQEEVVPDLTVKGIEAKHRTFLNNRHVRNIIKELLEHTEDVSALYDAVKALNMTELDDNTTSVLELLHRLLSESKFLPDGYITLFYELQLETPISALFTPYSSEKETYKTFLDYLNNKSDIFSSPTQIEKMINSFPVIIECIRNVLAAENSKALKNSPFLPTDVSTVLRNMVKLRFKFDKMSRQVAAPRVTPAPGFEPPKADFFPNYPIHTMENNYAAEENPEPIGSDNCEKQFNSTSSISGGIGTVSCGHKITKGFRAIRKGESPIIFCHSLLRRLPRKVRAHKRVVVYDFACKLHKCCLRRYPYRIRRFQFVIDRHHQSNHKACSQAYNISKYPKLNNVNTQIAEQLNNSLRKLSTVVAYSNFETYLKIIQIFITVKNLKIKGVI